MPSKNNQNHKGIKENLDHTYHKWGGSLYDEISASLSSCSLCNWNYDAYNWCMGYT